MPTRKNRKKINEVVQQDQILPKCLYKFLVVRKNVKTDKKDI